MKYLIIEIDNEAHGFGPNYTRLQRGGHYATLDGDYRVVRNHEITDEDDEILEWEPER